jgi:hemerythrin
MALIDVSDDRLALGVPAMDRTHREMADLVNRMADCSTASFVYLYPDLVTHTHTHFATEELLMRETRFPATAEHKSEHARVLGEMDAFGQRLAAGRIAMARAYVAEQLPAWFAVHLSTMDSALAAYVRAGANAKTLAARRNTWV